MRKIEAVILDWSGTIIDYGCMATEENYREIFEEHGISLKREEIRAKMGIDKVDHIRSILESDRVSKLWLKNTGMEPNEGDVRELNRHFEANMFEKVEEYCTPKDYVKQTLEKIRESGIRIGSTTSYSTEIMEFIIKNAEKRGIKVDCWISSEQVLGRGRPNPYMIFKNMEKMGVSSVKNVIKVGDTVSDIKEGKNAGVFTVGVVDGSSEIGLSHDKFEALSEDEKNALRKKAADKFKKAGADYVMNDFRTLPYIVAQMENKK